jgi:DNA-binding CsgD family transcriptional regulator
MMVEIIPSMEDGQPLSAEPTTATDAIAPATDADRDATPAEARALAHPLRLRILRLCIDDARTNREIAQRLDRDPGTTLYHVRRLVELGFLAPEPTRRAASGHLEQPYRITGKSWRLRVTTSSTWSTAVIDAVRDEVAEAGPKAAIGTHRLGVRLTAADIKELRARLDALATDFAGRDDPAGTPVGLLLLAHRRRD